MDVSQFWQPFNNIMATQRATADRRVDMAQNNALMDMKRQEFGMLQQQNALAMEQAQDQRTAQLAAQQRQQMFQQRTQDLLQGGMTPQGLQALAMEFPEESKALLSAWKDTRPEFDREGGQYIPKMPGHGAVTPVAGYTPPPPELDKGYQTFLTATGQQPSAESYRAWHESESRLRQSGAPRTSIINNNNMKRENEALGQAFGEFKDVYPAARSARQAITRIDRALDILDKHGNKVTGLAGTMRRALAPAATAAGIRIEGMNEAQILQSLLKEGAGGLRMAVVGPGPVSNYEQGILQAVSGGGMAAAEGVRKILEYHRENHGNNVELYNNRVQVLSQQPGYGLTGQLYPAIDMPKPRQGGARQPGGNTNSGGIQFMGFE